MNKTDKCLAVIKSRKTFVLLLGLIPLLCCTLLFTGCRKEKTYRIGILAGLDYASDIVIGFKEKMTELGYVEGKNVVYDVQHSNFDMAEYKRILQKFVADKVDVIFTFPTEATIEAKLATAESKIPVVFCFANIEDNNLINSVREPGGNLTGVRYPGPDLTVKRFELMRAIVPEATRLWIPYQKGYPVDCQINALTPVAEAAGVQIEYFPAADAGELQAELERRAQAADPGFDAILFLAEPLTVTPDAFSVLNNFAALRRIPMAGALISEGDYGTIFGVNVDFIPTGRQAATVVDKVLKGANPAVTPVISSESFFQINYKIVQKLGLNISETILNQADEIIR
ncbi:MAG TPA: ABC transporter substrate-binding protein [Capillibacterium sp.]